MMVHNCFGCSVPKNSLQKSFPMSSSARFSGISANIGHNDLHAVAQIRWIFDDTCRLICLFHHKNLYWA